MANSSTASNVDVVLIGAGIMSATLGAFLKALDPNISIAMYERLDTVAAESSDAWNNAGTGHAALCELNYTPMKGDTVDTTKAFGINEQFELSKQFWAYLVEKGQIKNPKDFLNQTPHMSFVKGDKDVHFLRTRYNNLKNHHFFKTMEYSEDHDTIAQWVPLIMNGRNPNEKVAATRVATGTDVNFGALTRILVDQISKDNNVNVHMQHEVEDLSRNSDQTWNIKVKDLATGQSKTVNTKFVFVGAGGYALLLIQKSGIEEGKGFGGFPVGGQWLRCTNPEVIKQHHAKVYGQAQVGAPPMSVPHLDTRMIDGKQELLFGPYAGFSTKFLKSGSYLNLFESVKLSNLAPMLKAGLANMDLTKYLISELKKDHTAKVESLKEYYPNVNGNDWKIEVAGQRVQIIKKDPVKGGVLQFGTEVVSAADGSVAALLGASPGASTSVPIMIKLLEKCFAKEMKDGWAAKIKEIIPSYGQSLEKDVNLYNKINQHSNTVLQIEDAI